MRLEFENRDGVIVFRLKGRFTTGSNDELASAKDHLQWTDITGVVVDISEVPYIDSTGLAFVVDLYKIMQARGGKLVLAGANGRVRDVLALTRISELIPAFDDRQAALASLGERGVLAAYAAR